MPDTYSRFLAGSTLHTLANVTTLCQVDDMPLQCNIASDLDLTLQSYQAHALLFATFALCNRSCAAAGQ